MPEIKLIQLNLIRIDGQTQYRDQVDQRTVKEYAECMRNDAEFPPVSCTFDGTHYWLWDGFHRFLATQAADFRDIHVQYTHGTLEDAQDLALGANGKHGIPRNNATKRLQVEAALSMERHANKSDREIARLCDVSAPFVASVRNPATKEKQAQNRQTSAAKYGQSNSIQQSPEAGVQGVIGLHPQAAPLSRPNDSCGPSQEEVEIAETAFNADQDMKYKMLESDEAFKLVVEENQRLKLRVAQLEARLRELVNKSRPVVHTDKPHQKAKAKIKTESRLSLHLRSKADAATKPDGVI
jgi:hypothetical protein